MITILDTQSVRSEDEKRIQELFKQLSDRGTQNVHELLADPNNSIHLAVIREDDSIIGMASLSTYRVVSGYKGWIEDVVIDQAHRGKGLGKLLIQYLIKLGKKKELSEIYLFTEEEKEAAIYLYETLGFLQKNSRLYHMKL